MGKQAKIKSERREEHQAEKTALVDLQNSIRYIRGVALNPLNMIDAISGEDITTKAGTVPGSDGVVPLKRHLSTALKFPGWPTHMVMTFTRERVKSPEGPKVMLRLSILQHAPIAAPPEEILPLRDQLIRKTIAPDLLSMWFPEGGNLLCAMNSMQPFENDDGQEWTPIVLHFYVDENAPKPERSEGVMLNVNGAKTGSRVNIPGGAYKA